MAEADIHWDAVRAPAPIGERALALRGGQSGAVIADYAHVYWLIRPGTAHAWRRIRQVRILRTTLPTITYVGVPPITRTTGPRLHWHIPVGPNRYLTDAHRLREALVRSVIAELGLSKRDPSP
ncbi:hypothetical protein [Streptomyces cucumeris]|uniref:hypothetical protein n=1 Tax=Streptomyces cucumeris TaxID=2962890 RepID=UPI003D727523